MSWLLENLPWIITGLLGTIDTYRYTQGTKAEKAFEAAKKAHEVYKRRQFDEAIAALKNAASDSDLVVARWQDKLSAADAMLLSRRPGATKEEIEAGRIAREKYEAGTL